MFQKHVAFVPRNKWGQAPFCKKEDIIIQKMGPGPIYSPGYFPKPFLITEIDMVIFQQARFLFLLFMI